MKKKKKGNKFIDDVKEEFLIYFLFFLILLFFILLVDMSKNIDHISFKKMLSVSDSQNLTENIFKIKR